MHFFLSIEKRICRKANDRPYLRTFIALSHPLVFDGLPQWKIVPRGHAEVLKIYSYVGIFIENIIILGILGTLGQCA